MENQIGVNDRGHNEMPTPQHQKIADCMDSMPYASKMSITYEGQQINTQSTAQTKMNPLDLVKFDVTLE